MSLPLAPFCNGKAKFSGFKSLAALALLLALPSSTLFGQESYFLSYRFSPSEAKSLDPNALNVGVSFGLEPPSSHSCAYVHPTGNAPTSGTVTYGFRTMPGEMLGNVIVAQYAVVFSNGGITGEYSTDDGATFRPFFQTEPYRGSLVASHGKSVLRGLNSSTLLIRYTLVLSTAKNYEVQLSRDCDDAPSWVQFDFDTPVAVVTLPRTLNVNATTGGTVARTPAGPNYPRHTVVTVTAEPETGYAFRGWFGDVISQENPLTLVMDETKSVTALFAPIADIDHCASAPSGLVRWWSADGNTLDSATQRFATLKNGLTYTAGHSDLGFSFDGVDEHLEVQPSAFPVPWTVSVWVNRQDSIEEQAHLFGGTSTALKVEQWRAQRRVGFTQLGVGDWAFSYSAPTNQWVHLVFAAVSGTTRLYVNGQLEDSIAAVIPLSFNRIGTASGGDPRLSLKGRLDEIMVFNRGLSTAEIGQIHNAGRSGACKQPRIIRVLAPQSGQFSFEAIGSAAKRVGVMRSDDLINWTPSETFENPTGRVTITIPALSPTAFFRAHGDF